MKTLQQMFDYAKKIVDADEHAYVVFLVKDTDEYTGVKNVMTNRQLGIYKGKGTILFGIIPSIHEECCSRWAGAQITHLFLSDYASPLVYSFLKSRVRTLHKLTEKQGIYFPWGVERTEDY